MNKAPALENDVPRKTNSTLTPLKESNSNGVAVRYKRKLEFKSQVVDEYKQTALDGMKRALQKMEESDSFQTFGNFVAAELRKIPNKTEANIIQRRVQRKLLDYIDEYEMNSESRVNVASQTEHYNLIDYDPEDIGEVIYYDSS